MEGVLISYSRWWFSQNAALFKTVNLHNVFVFNLDNLFDPIDKLIFLLGNFIFHTLNILSMQVTNYSVYVINKNGTDS